MAALAAHIDYHKFIGNSSSLKSCIPLVYLTSGGMRDVRAAVIPPAFINFKMPMVY